MEPLSIEYARWVIEDIRENKGEISRVARETSHPQALRALANVRRELGRTMKVFVDELYSKDTRFLYELIQNAEDNTYTRVDGKIYLCFTLYSDRLVLDSNEDGFQEQHVRAICSTKASTKALSQGFIGEKGIGFKSVFKVAKKVHIQSHPFYFSFTHKNDSSDDGLGIVTPYEEDYDLLPEGVNTRITLTLLDPSSFEQRADELLTLPDTLLLFLSKLQLLHVKIHPQNKIGTEIMFTHTAHENKLETITKTTISDGKSTDQNLDFYVLRRDIKDLPPNKARSNNGATVVLAFPVDVAKTPIVMKQLVYAFLPLKNLGFTFLIQSDFILQANREDVVHSERNKALLLGVAETFRDAILHFCQQSIIRYQWARYLPDDSISDEFWRELNPHIVSLLKDTPILLPWSETKLRLPREVYHLPDWLRDEHGQPLFADSEEEEYLSPQYTRDDLDRLDTLGLKHVHWTDILRRFSADLKTTNPRMRVNDPIDENWHTRVAKTFSRVLSPRVDWLWEKIKKLELIPLQGSTPVSANVKPITSWVTAENMPIYFPNTRHTLIPSDLGLALVEQTAASNKERKILFSQLGVIDASSSDIVSLIIKRYTSPSKCAMDQNIAHLQYLYWNLPHDTQDLAKTIYLFDKEGQGVLCIQSHMEHMYFEEEEEDWQQLLKCGPTENGESPGLYVHFLNSKYIDAVSATERQHGRSWKDWLSEIVGVQRYPQLLNHKRNSLSDEFRYIINYRPEKLVWLLKRFWHVYQHNIIGLPAVVEELRSCQVPADGETANPLWNTYLPLPRLTDLASRLEIVEFPFLKMPEELTEENGDDWQFLTAFGVTSTDDLFFYVAALNRVSLENEVECEPKVLDALFKIYDALEQKCLDREHSTYIRNFFKRWKVIYIPSNSVRAAEWVTSEVCVWKGPEWLKTKRSLYGASKFSTLDRLFHVILKIPNAGWKEYLEDLNSMKTETHVDAAKVTDIYRRLCREFQDDSIPDSVRSLFETSELVYLPSKNTWVNLSSCIWAEDDIRIPAKEPLKTAYLELELFFHELLGVPKPDLKMHVHGLIRLAGNLNQPSEFEIKGLINVISSFNPSADDVAELQGANIFFVTTQAGQKTRTNSAASFAIIDRLEYGRAFNGKISMLDYTIEEVNACKPLFHSLGMKKKYLSELVEETTSVHGGEVSTKLTESFRMKAYAFVRCTEHYLGPQRKEENIALYNNLRNASVYVSDGIVKSMSVVQCGESITVEKSRANFHLEENDQGLQLYVPQEENSRQICTNRQLPKRLMAFLYISGAEAQLVITGVINCGTLDAVDGVLQDAGIVEVDGMVQPQDTAQKMYPSGNGDNSSKDCTQAFGAGKLTRTQSPCSDDGHPPNTSAALTALTTSFAEVSIGSPRSQRTVFDQSTGPSASFSPASSYQSQPFRLSPAELVRPERLMEIANPDVGYASLLEHVIQSAGRITIPAQGDRSVDPSPSLMLADNMPYVSLFAGRSVETDRKIGAAGELLVFEILTNLDLAGFSEANWQSTIRKEVRVHSKYMNLEPWQGREIADLQYYDSEGCFTKQLIEKGYLKFDTWKDARPTYYLEVKTTKKNYDEKFFMSGAQYNRMQDMKLQPEKAGNIYVILRVFNLEGRIGLQIYVDPEASQVDGTLKFTVNTWEVKHTEVV